MKPVIRDNLGSMKPGQDLVVAGFAGLKGSRVIASAKRKELMLWFAEDYIDRMAKNSETEIICDLEQWKEFGAAECEPVKEGGILAALWNLSGAYQTGIECSLRLIPVRQETIEICERYDLNPYRLLSEHCFLMAAQHGADLVTMLGIHHIPAVVIGKVNPGIKRVIHNGETRGFLDRPAKDELKKVVPEYFK